MHEGPYENEASKALQQLHYDNEMIEFHKASYENEAYKLLK